MAKKYGVWCTVERPLRELYSPGWLHGSNVNQKRVRAAFESPSAARRAVRLLRATSNVLTGWRASIRELPR